jgi:hypothetical protein
LRAPISSTDFVNQGRQQLALETRFRPPISSTDFVTQGRQQLALETGEDVSVLDVQNVMERMQQRNRELFKVPPYILYVARAFSTPDEMMASDGL